MERIVRAPGEFGIDGDEILHRRDLGGKDDAAAGQADLLRQRRRHEGRADERLARHGPRLGGLGQSGVLVHEGGEELLVQRAPVGADAHRLVVAHRGLDDGRELPVLLGAEAHIAGIDAVFVQRLRAGGMVRQQLVADVMEIAHQRHVDALPQQALLDARHGGSALVPVHGDAHDLGAGAGQRRHLAHGAVDVGGIGVGHGLDHDGRITADDHLADRHRNGGPPGGGAGFQKLVGHHGDHAHLGVSVPPSPAPAPSPAAAWAGEGSRRPEAGPVSCARAGSTRLWRSRPGTIPDGA